MEKEIKTPGFGPTLRRYRKTAGLSQEELGARLGYETANYISCLEIGTRKPSVELLFKIAHALGVKPSELIQDMENQPGE
ncbi:helix-turn-helix domain-containing protein [Desulfovibrio sp. OttesenSCG-928-C14]|nr:helix-turn-helix domain-containing protein [Desulfovibrio sp. OttesenSCG-928-C14]